MPLSAADRQLAEYTVKELATILRKRAGRKGTRLARLIAELEAAVPGRHLLQIIDTLGDVLAKQADELSLSVATHADALARIEPLNRGSAQWLTAFFATAEGPDISDVVVRNLEQLSSDFLLESHHVVEHRIRKHFPVLQQKFPQLPGDGDRPGQMAMITVALPAQLHRGARYYNLEGKKTALAALRRQLPARDVNVTTLLNTAFPDSRVRSMAYRDFLHELSAFYKREVPLVYTSATLPTRGTGGIREALLQIARITEVPESIIVP